MISIFNYFHKYHFNIIPIHLCWHSILECPFDEDWPLPPDLPFAFLANPHPFVLCPNKIFDTIDGISRKVKCQFGLWNRRRGQQKGRIDRPIGRRSRAVLWSKPLGRLRSGENNLGGFNTRRFKIGFWIIIIFFMTKTIQWLNLILPPNLWNTIPHGMLEYNCDEGLWLLAEIPGINVPSDCRLANTEKWPLLEFGMKTKIWKLFLLQINRLNYIEKYVSFSQLNGQRILYL